MVCNTACMVAATSCLSKVTGTVGGRGVGEVVGRGGAWDSATVGAAFLSATTMGGRIVEEAERNHCAVLESDIGSGCVWSRRKKKKRFCGVYVAFDGSDGCRTKITHSAHP